MKALAYHGAYDARMERVPDPAIRQPDDITLRVKSGALRPDIVIVHELPLRYKLFEEKSQNCRKVVLVP